MNWDPYLSPVLLVDRLTRRGSLNCDGVWDHALGPEGVVLHMRGGDIMVPNSQSGYYSQPPCAYYQWVVEYGNNYGPFKDVLIVSQDRRNPCIDFIQNLHPGKVRFQSSSLREDACTLASAQNLACSLGTFCITLGSVNKNVKNQYLADGIQLAFHSPVRMPYNQYLVTCPNYDISWTSWNDRVNKMTTFPLKNVHHHIIPAEEPTDNESTETITI